CCSLVNKSTLFSSVTFSVFSFFPIQVAVYTRQELNIRITANFLLALAANLPLTKSHVRRYFCTAVQLPSDWLEVVRIYSTVSLSEFPLHSLPMCLKKAMADKFKEFSEYQLAKYNTRKQQHPHIITPPPPRALRYGGYNQRSDIWTHQTKAQISTGLISTPYVSWPKRISSACCFSLVTVS
uniref:TROVE domain-containing protein n=1 Tax=Amphiprion percula TaxID=161767 RepID=A0A3P8TTE8_AMPPE